MHPARAAGLIVGLGVSLSGLYVLSDGITGFITAKQSFLSIPQIPMGLVIITVGVLGTVFLERMFAKKIESEPQQTVAAPSSEFKEKEVVQSQLGQEKPETIVKKIQEVNFEEPHNEVVSSEKVTFQFPSVQVQNTDEQSVEIEKNQTKTASQAMIKKSAKKKSVRKTAKKLNKKSQKSASSNKKR
ncbi:MAG TPA: hypothetical protein VJB90_00870 [Candidatus Nanoarchaeia archaeon]|nr:hypothetical protein [Candidatus Nanoarchaeia archaeon]